ncbi:MAG: RNA methyltransferase, partial [Clostridia bacterium]
HVASLLSDTKNPQGVFALCSFSEKNASINGKVLVMENLQDPGNIGTIFRTAEALGIETLVLLGDCCDVYSPKVIRSTMGAIFRVNFLKAEDFNTFFSLLKNADYQCFAAVPSDKAENVTKLNFSEKTAVFIGNEGNGLSEICKSTLKNITIPMNGNAESLNASIAASIIMWEMVRNV